MAARSSGLTAALVSVTRPFTLTPVGRTTLFPSTTGVIVTASITWSTFDASLDTGVLSRTISSVPAGRVVCAIATHNHKKTGKSLRIQRYNAGVTPRLLVPLALMAASLACNRAPDSKEAVREGVIEHLNKNTGLDLKSMDVAVDNVTFEGNRATASVSFKPKSSPDAGMSMNYSLERSGKKWVVQKTAGGHGGGSAMPSPGSGALPPGHPPAGQDGGTQSKAPRELPPGHPPVAPQTEAPKK
jgi:hypothetical protein